MPDTISDQVRIRLSDVKDAGVFSVSQPLEIKADFVLKSPSGNETWNVGNSYEISWNTVGTVPEVNIDYSHDGFKRDVRSIVKALPNRGSFAWNVADAISPTVWIRISDTRDANSWGVHDVPFRIRGTLAFSNLNENKTVQVGDEISMEWVTTGTVPRVRLEYFSESNPEHRKVIEDQAPNQGTFFWQVPDDIGHDFKMRVSDSSDLGVQAVSEGILK